MALDGDFDDKDELIGALTYYSGRERWAWDALNVMAQAALRNRSEPLSPELATWLANVLAGKEPRPRAGGKRLVNRDLAIAEAIVMLGKRYGLKPTRSLRGRPECCAEGGSACDAVGVVSGMNYKAVERIWTEWGNDAFERLKDKDCAEAIYDWANRLRQSCAESETK